MASGVIQVMSTDRNDQVKRQLKASSTASRLDDTRHQKPSSGVDGGNRVRAGASFFEGVARYEQP